MCRFFSRWSFVLRKFANLARLIAVLYRAKPDFNDPDLVAVLGGALV